MNIATRMCWWTLVILAGFGALSAVGGAVAILFTGGTGMGMPISLLDNSPFRSFTLPALILLVVIGGTQLATFTALVRRWSKALTLSTIAGFAMVIWIVVETVIVNGFSVLQAIYLVVGLAELALVIALLGLVSWIPELKRKAPPKRGQFVKT